MILVCRSFSQQLGVYLSKGRMSNAHTIGNLKLSFLLILFTLYVIWLVITGHALRSSSIPISEIGYDRYGQLEKLRILVHAFI